MKPDTPTDHKIQEAWVQGTTQAVGSQNYTAYHTLDSQSIQEQELLLQARKSITQSIVLHSQDSQRV